MGQLSVLSEQEAGNAISSLHDTYNLSSLTGSKVHSQRWHKFHNSMLYNICSFLWEDLREVNYQVWWLRLTLVSNKFNTRKRKPYYEVEAEAGGTLFLVLTIRSNYPMLEKPEKPAGKEWLIVSCLIKVAALSLSLSIPPPRTHSVGLFFKPMPFAPKREPAPMVC